MSLVVHVTKLLERAGSPFALIGAAAVALRGYPRFTQDTDFLTTDRRALHVSFWEELTHLGEIVEIRTGDFDDPLAGVVRIGKLPDQIDVIVGKWKWEQQVIARAEPMDALGGTVLVPTTSDLILLKLAAGGYKDLVDAAGLFSLGPRKKLIAEINSRISDLSRDAQAEWVKLVAATG